MEQFVRVIEEYHLHHYRRKIGELPWEVIPYLTYGKPFVQFNPAPIPDNAYGNPNEQDQRGPRKLRGVLLGTRVGIPGRPDVYPRDPKGK